MTKHTTKTLPTSYYKLTNFEKVKIEKVKVKSYFYLFIVS